MIDGGYGLRARMFTKHPKVNVMVMKDGNQEKADSPGIGSGVLSLPSQPLETM